MATRYIRRSGFVGDDRRLIYPEVTSDIDSTITSGNLIWCDVDGQAFGTPGAIGHFDSIDDQGTKAQNQAYARDRFIGVAQQTKTLGQQVAVATSGVFEFDCSSASFVVGDYVGPAGTGASSAVGVSNTIVEKVANGSMAIGRVVRGGTSMTRVQVEIFSVVMAFGGSSGGDDTIYADIINELTTAAGVTIDGVLLKDGTVKTNTIIEETAATGVTIDGVLVKDTGISNADLTLTSTNEINILIGTVSMLALDDAAISGNTAAAATAGKSCFAETQTAGAGAADTAGPVGASLTLTAGAGGAGGAHTSNNPNGGDSGCITLATRAGGAAGSGGSGAAGAGGNIRLNAVAGAGGVLVKQAAPAAKTTSVTLTAAELLNGIITGTHSAGATQNYTVPTGTLMDAALAADVGADEGFFWTLINLSAAAADTITVLAGTDHTVVGNMIVQSAHATTGELYGNSARFFTRKTAANTFVTYRVG